jgi:hypothetical protein
MRACISRQFRRQTSASEAFHDLVPTLVVTGGTVLLIIVTTLGAAVR